jgi:hypothetical protein
MGASFATLLKYQLRHVNHHPIAAMKLIDLMLPARNYESEHTKFIRELMDQNPRLEQEQRKGRAIWWDKRPRDLAEGEVMDEGKVAQQGYVYQNE